METNVLWASWVITRWADIIGQILSKNHLGCAGAQFDCCYISGARETGLVADVAVVVMLLLWSFLSCFFQVIGLSAFAGPIEALKGGFPHFTVCLLQSQEGLSGNFKKDYPIIRQM